MGWVDGDAGDAASDVSGNANAAGDAAADGDGDAGGGSDGEVDNDGDAEIGWSVQSDDPDLSFLTFEPQGPQLSNGDNIACLHGLL